MGLRSLLLTILAIIAQSSFGQESEPPKLTAHSELVVVPVVVTSGSVPVGGLSAKDFTIKQDGKRVVIASFEAMDTRPLEPVDQPELSPRTAQNFLSVGETRQDLVIVLLDFLNNSWSSGARIRSYLAEMARTLEQTRAPFAVCVVTKKGLVQIQSIGNGPHDF